MKGIHDARIHARKWLAYLEFQRAKSLKLQEIAKKRRSGELNQTEAKRALKNIDSSPLVYDAAQLAFAVKTLIKYTDHLERI